MELARWQFLNLKMSFGNLLKIFLKGLKSIQMLCQRTVVIIHELHLFVSSFQVLTVNLCGIFCALFTCITCGIKNISARPPSVACALYRVQIHVGEFKDLSVFNF